MKPDLLFNRPSLSYKDNRVYRIFNIMSVLTIIVLLIITVFLLSIGAITPFWICMGELVIFISLMVAHVKGHFIISRYIFFSFAILMQVVGSLYHGENGGYDFLFLTTAFCPVLFFEKRVHYLSLFILSISTFMVVKILYAHIEPLIPFEKALVPYYLNIVLSTLLIYFCFDLFKSEHLKYEKVLNEKNKKIKHQKETLATTKTQLEVLLEDKSKKLEVQNLGISKYAYLNSHRARSPLARILGLVNLTKFEDLNDEEKRSYYFTEITDNAKELDTVLTEISEILDKDLEV
ncbi:hypothetical protein [Fulvivirga sp.]|uniref:hypothetical protein n=1 Tax=Fulvivirga sp. TaxID=1931237 RepID=UPI0032F08D34